MTDPWNRRGDAEGVVLALIALMFVSFLTAVMVGVLWEGLAAVRARPQILACYRQNKEARRPGFSSKVACTSRQTGADTLNVRQVAP